MRKDESTSAKKNTSATNKQPKMRSQSLADADRRKSDDGQEDATTIPKRQPRSSATKKKLAFFDLVTNRIRRERFRANDNENEGQQQPESEDMERMPSLTTHQINEMAENFLVRNEDNDPDNSNILPVANRVSARDVTVLSGEDDENNNNAHRGTVVMGFLVPEMSHTVLREPIYDSAPWLTPLCLLVTGAFLLVILIVSLVVALTTGGGGETGVSLTAFPLPSTSPSPTTSATSWPSMSASPTFLPSFSPSVHPTEYPTLSTSPSALPTMANVTWSQVGGDVVGVKDGESIGTVTLSANGNELRVVGNRTLRVYLLAGTDDWILNEDLSDSITTWGNVAVSLDGYTIVAGDTHHDDYTGRAMVYRRVGANWERRGDWKVGKNIYEYFGYAVTMNSNGTVVVMGAWGGDYLRVYRDEEGASGNLTLVTTIEGDARSSYFSYSLAMSADGSRLIVGAPKKSFGRWINQFVGASYDQWVGAVYVYALFPEHTLLQRMDGDEAFDLLGESVDTSSKGDLLAAGTGTVKENGGNYAKVYAADDSSRRRFSLLGNRVDGLANSWFGFTVSLSADGTRLAVGAPNADPKSENVGRAFVYALHPSRHQRIGEFGGDAPGDNFGWCVSLSGDGTRVAVGALESDLGGENSGLARVFEST